MDSDYIDTEDYDGVNDANGNPINMDSSEVHIVGQQHRTADDDSRARMRMANMGVDVSRDGGQSTVTVLLIVLIVVLVLIVLTHGRI